MALYTELPSAHHIRVLRFQVRDGLETCMEIIDLDENPLYCCLSYTWGSPTWNDEGEEWLKLSRDLNVNSHSLPVGLNLNSSLKHIAGLLNGSAIWIDAICINQQDIKERNVQVASMGRIYEQAQEVIVWLGEGPSNVSQIFQNMNRMGLSLEEWAGRILKQTLTETPDLTLHDVFYEKFFESGLSGDEHVDIIRFLVGNRWFSRMWTLQEFLLAKHVKFLCGNIVASMETIWKGCSMNTLFGVTKVWKELFETHKHKWVTEFGNNIPLKYLQQAELLKDLPSSIGVRAHEFRDREATDPRDKVYGVAGISTLTSKWVKEPFVIDYSLDVQVVFRQAALHGLVAWRGLEALSHVGDHTENKIPNLPSWVPDFTNSLPWKPFQKGGGSKFAAASSMQTVLWVDHVKMGAIVINTAYLGTIASTCDAYWGEGQGKDLGAFLKNVLHPSVLATSDHKQAATAILQLLVADGFRNDGVDPRVNLLDSFGDWLFAQVCLCEEVLHHKNNMFQTFHEDPEGSLQLISTSMGLEPGAIDIFLDLFVSASNRLKTLKDLDLAFKGRYRTIGPFKKHTESRRTEFAMQWDLTGNRRKAFRTSNGHLGLGPRTIKDGDVISLVQGGLTPYVFRHLPNDPLNVFDLVGEAYLNGVMYGEALEWENLTWGKITLY